MIAARIHRECISRATEEADDLNPSALFVTTVPVTLRVFLAPFAEHFRARGWRIDALAAGATTDAELSSSFDSLFDAPWSRNPLDPRNVFGAAGAVRRVVRARAYDIVHVHTPIAAFVTRFALRSLPAEEKPIVIYTAHGFHFYDGQARRPHALFRALERTAAPWTDYLVTINEEDFRAAGALGAIARERIRLIPGVGVDTDRFTPEAASHGARQSIRGELGVPDDAFMAVIVAELAPVKRHELLLEALSRVADERVVLVIVGDGPLEQRLRAQASILGIEGRIRWTGYRRDVPEILAASDVLMLVSEREGLNRSVLEAMATGVPVIGTDTRGIADAVTAETGWIVPKHSANALAGAIDTAAADPAEVARRGRAARDRAVAEYSLPRILTAYEELYDEALASRL